MPVKSKRPCKKFGCSNLTRYPNKYCNDHMDLEEKEKAARNSYYDRKIRDERCTKFYHSKEWIRTRNYVMSKYNGLDLFAYFIEKKIIYAAAVHHIEELKENWDKRLDIDNLFPVSEQSHNKIHAMYKKDKKNTQKLLLNLIKKWKKEMGEGV